VADAKVADLRGILVLRTMRTAARRPPLTTTSRSDRRSG
jgi:hypothetical protein